MASRTRRIFERRRHHEWSEVTAEVGLSWFEISVKFWRIIKAEGVGIRMMYERVCGVVVEDLWWIAVTTSSGPSVEIIRL